MPVVTAAAAAEKMVHRFEPVLVSPAEPTPHEWKPLSDIDDSIRFHLHMIHLYRPDPSMAGRDPAAVIRDALAKALVPYYPLAGRLRETPGCNKLAVDCTGEGVLFIEADIDLRLDDLGDAPPFRYQDELLVYEAGVVDSPLLAIQVTRLKCGGFVFAIGFNHTMADGPGLGQFLKAVAEMARGAAAPAVLPVWERELLTTPHQPQPPPQMAAPPAIDMAVRSFFFGPEEISALRERASKQLKGRSTTFEFLAANVWRSSAAALDCGNDDGMVCMNFPANFRGRCAPPLPAGFYGNAMTIQVARARVLELRGDMSLGHAVDVVREAKGGVNEGGRSVDDLLALGWTPELGSGGTVLMSDHTRAGFNEVDLGWGRPVYAGPTMDDMGSFPGVKSFCVPFVNSEGVAGILVPVGLPASAMKRFEAEMESVAA